MHRGIIPNFGMTSSPTTDFTAKLAGAVYCHPEGAADGDLSTAYYRGDVSLLRMSTTAAIALRGAFKLTMRYLAISLPEAGCP